MPFKSRSQEDLFVAATASSSSADTSDTCRDDRAVAMTMTSLLLLRPDASAAAAADTVSLPRPVMAVNLTVDYSTIVAYNPLAEITPRENPPGGDPRGSVRVRSPTHRSDIVRSICFSARFHIFAFLK